MRISFFENITGQRVWMIQFLLCRFRAYADDTECRKTTPRHSIMTRSKKVTEEAKATTLAILKNVRTSNSTPEETKENKKQQQQEQQQQQPQQQPPAKPAGEKAGIETQDGCRYEGFPRAERNYQLPCAQYKTEKGYKCPNCQRCYNARKNLVRHVTLECGREPQYKCPYCVYSKHRRNELKKHIDKKHPDTQHAADQRRHLKPV
ncbi:zinc finger protein sens-like [Galleria mellonella]|uniref:Zinc finger protein sens-like n=1 Tax=Galleria mellonella TaxID=7137 RepID=A0ABM3MF95_GALME|nr:zinc finger protein sens-like [Galleria mellonella]